MFQVIILVTINDANAALEICCYIIYTDTHAHKDVLIRQCRIHGDRYFMVYQSQDLGATGPSD